MSISDVEVPLSTTSPTPTTQDPRRTELPEIVDSKSIKPTIQSAIDYNTLLLNNARPLKILLLSSDTGGGHRASAQALQKALEKVVNMQHQSQQQPPNSSNTLLDVKVIDFWVDGAKGPFSNFPQQYTFLAKHPWMWKFTYEITRFPPGRAITESFFSTFGHNEIRDTFLNFNPDIILSVHPLVNTLSIRVLKDLLKRKFLLKKPCYLTVVTDLASAHPTWFNPQVDRMYIPLETIRKTAVKCGLSETQCKVYGLPLRSDFWVNNDISATSKQAVRQQLGIMQDVNTIMLVGGGDGVGGLKSVVLSLLNELPKKLVDSRTREDASARNSEEEVVIQIVVICGKNEKLRKLLTEQKLSKHVSLVPLGYITNMSEWMSACDMICTKAGPGTIAESLVRGLPMVITGFLPGQEEANVKFITEQNVGKFAKKPDKIIEIIVDWLNNEDQLRQMSMKCQELSRPNATIDIATDIYEYSMEHIKQNIKELKDELSQQENEKMERELKLKNKKSKSRMLSFIPMRQYINDDEYDTLVNTDPNHLSNNGGVPNSDNEWTSHLSIRLKVLMRVVFGGLLFRDVTRRGRSRSSSPGNYQMETISENGERPRAILGQQD